MRRASSSGSAEGPVGRRRARLRAVLLAAVGVLYAISIPWYRAPGRPPAIVLGLPDWVLLALGCYVGIAVCTAAAWLLTDVADGEEPEQ